MYLAFGQFYSVTEQGPGYALHTRGLCQASLIAVVSVQITGHERQHRQGA